MLWLGLHERRREQLKNRPLRALSFLIEQVALRVTDFRAANPEDYSHAELAELQNQWRTDPFRYRAFKVAVGRLLEALTPPGEIKSPITEDVLRELQPEEPEPFDFAFLEHVKQKWKTPESLAFAEFASLWESLNLARPPMKRHDSLCRANGRG